MSEIFALDVALKATVLIVGACTAHAALGRRRALARSALWNACLAGLLLLPAASAALPPLRVEVLEPPIPARNVALPVSPPVELPPVVSVPVVPPTIRAAKAAARPTVTPRVGPVGLVLGAYLAIAALLAVRLAASLAAVGRLRRGCLPVDDPAWSAALDRWRAGVGVGVARGLALVRSDRVSVPIVVGWLRPAVVLPCDLAGTASPGVIDAVLLHELGHVRRGDFAWNVVRKLVQLVYWPHPLVWPIGRIVGAVREQACDDLCVHALGSAAAYRASLLEVASRLVRRPEPALGLAMARRANLGRRLDWIDRSRGAPRCVLGRPARLALLATVVPLAGVLGSIELARAEAPDDLPAKVERPEAGPASTPDAIEVIVLGRDGGRPLEGARVRTLNVFTPTVQEAGRDGRVRVDLSRRASRETLVLDVWAEGYVQQRHFFSQDGARAPKIPARLTVELLPGEETLGGTVTDEQGRPIAGVKVEVWGYLGEKKDPREMAFMVDAATDDQGRWRCRCFRSMTFAYLFLSHPDYVSDEPEFHPRRHGKPDRSYPDQPGDRPMEALRDFSDVQVMTRGVALAGSVADAHGKPVAGAEVAWFETTFQGGMHSNVPSTTTDAAGRFRFPHVPPRPLTVQVKAKGYAPEMASIRARDVTKRVAMTLGPPRALAGRVVDSRWRPVPDAFVNVESWRGIRALGVYLKTDAQGRFRWDDAPPDAVKVFVSRPGYLGTDRSLSPGGDEETLILKRVLEISGRVRDAATGEPIEGAVLEVGARDPETGEVVWARQSRSFALQGRLQARVDVESTPEFRLRIKAAGYQPAVSRTFRGDEAQVEYDFELTKATGPAAPPRRGS